MKTDREWQQWYIAKAMTDGFHFQRDDDPGGSAANTLSKIVIRKRNDDTPLWDDDEDHSGWSMHKMFSSIDFTKLNIRKADVSDPLRGPREKDDDQKLSDRLKEFTAVMVAADPSKTQEQHLYDLLHSAQGRKLAEHLNNLTKKESPMSPQVDIFKMQNIDSVHQVCKSITAGTMELSEFDFTRMVKGHAELTKQSFEKVFVSPEIQQTYRIVREATHLQALGYRKTASEPQRVEPLPGYGATYDQLLEMRKSTGTQKVPPLMDFKPRSVEVGSTEVESDADSAWGQALKLVEQERKKAPTLTIDQLFALVFANNPKLRQMANRNPDWHSAATSKSEITETDDMSPEEAYDTLYAEAEKIAESGDITVAKAFEKLFEKNTPLARRANLHSVEGIDTQAPSRNKNLYSGGIAPRVQNAR
jgi:hypothetical protein